jgi:hypothetical protein
MIQKYSLEMINKQGYRHKRMKHAQTKDDNKMLRAALNYRPRG